jgi:hypothetical protein
MAVYEHLLDRDRSWALDEGGLHFEGKSAVQRALRRITHRLDELGIPYAVAGALALFEYGYRRFTEVVDLLVTRDGLKAVHDHLEGRGYVPLFAGAKNLRDAEHGVRIEFLVAGDFPGDGRPEPVAFPDPAAARIDRDGISYVRLPTLIELKLASGMTNPGRLKDLADVQELIRALDLPADFAAQLNPFVQDRFRELWNGVHQDPPEPEHPEPEPRLVRRPPDG